MLGETFFVSQICYPLVMTNIAIEDGHRHGVGLPIQHGDFPCSYVKLQYQRVKVEHSKRGLSSNKPMGV